MTNFKNPRTIAWLGPNLEKAKRVYSVEQQRAKKVFLRKYPHAEIDEFEFRASVNQEGNLVQQAVIYYGGDGTKLLANYNNTIASKSWPITSRTFREKYSSALYSGSTIIWNPKAKVQPFQRSEATLPFNVLKFNIYVSKDQSFVSNFPLFQTNWINKEESKNILEARFDTTDPYFASVASAYLLSTVSGVCKKHLSKKKTFPRSSLQSCVFFFTTTWRGSYTTQRG